MNTKGKFIVFEGIDGSGKSTQLKILSDRLKARGILCRETLEPTYGIVGSTLRNILTGRIKADPKVIAGLFVSDRLDHLLNDTDGICKYINDGTTVLCDRYYFSSYAYQSVEVPIDWVIGANSLCRETLKPDCTIFIDVSPETAMDRITKNRTQTELYENKTRLEAVRNAYFSAFDIMKDTEKVAIFDGNQDMNTLADEIEGFILQNFFKL